MASTQHQTTCLTHFSLQQSSSPPSPGGPYGTVIGGRARVVNVVGTLRVEVVVWGLAGTVAEVLLVVVDET